MKRNPQSSTINTGSHVFENARVGNRPASTNERRSGSDRGGRVATAEIRFVRARAAGHRRYVGVVRAAACAPPPQFTTPAVPVLVLL